MNQLSMFILVFFLLFLHVEAQAPHDLNQVRANPPGIASAFRPSLAVIVGILSIMFLLTFLLLVYAKFCHSNPMNRAAADMLQDQHNHGLAGSVPRFSGIDKTVIESLPFFRFSALKGSKEGLECSVCLSKFEESEILRLLPKCKHAFHINCVDPWLESHSSCPLCRCKVAAEDLAIFAYSNSLRFSWNHSQLIEDPNLELFVEREQDNHGSSRFSIGGSFRKILELGKKQELPTRKVSDPNDDGKLLHKFKHKMIVSDVVFKSRWSDLTSADVMFLNSEMFNLVSSRRFSSLESNSERFGGNDFETGSSKNDEIMKIKEEMEMKRSFESKVSAVNKNHSFTISSLPSSSSNSGENLIRNSRILLPEDKRSKSEIQKFQGFRIWV